MNYHKFRFVVLATASLSAAPVMAQQATPQITAAINESVRVAPPGNTRPEAIPANDRGSVADDFAMADMQLQLRRPLAQEQAFERVIDAMYTPGSPSFHQWLTASQIGTQFGPAQSDVDTVAGWLRSHGFRVNAIYPSRMMIDFSGTAGEVRAAFATEIHNLSVDGVHHIANMRDPSFPAALAPVIAGIVSLHDFRPHAMKKPRAKYTFTQGGSPVYAMVPADLATIYNFKPLFEAGITGKGQTIVTVEDTDLYKNSNADFNRFRSVFGLNVYTSGSLTTVHPAAPAGTGSTCEDPGVPSGGDDGEAAVDVEWASAAAPNAAILLASCADTSVTFGGLIALQNLLNTANPPAIISISYGNCEAEDGTAQNESFYKAYEQASAEGMSVFVAAGDENAASCDAGLTIATHGIGISGWAETPYNVAVGGTDFGDSYANTNSTYWANGNTGVYGSAKSYINEIPWNDSCASQLVASYNGANVTYGSSGFCNTNTAKQDGYLTVAGGSGGPSGCATGDPSISSVVSGTCKGYAKPSWQKGFLGNPSDGVRDIPDVSLFAADGIWGHYLVDCWSDIKEQGASCAGAPSTWDGGGGTSYSTPIVAGIQALIDQKTGKRQGNPNPVYYALAATEYGKGGSAACNSTLGKSASSKCIFYDVRQGDMDVNCRDYNCYRPSGSEGVLSSTNSAYAPAYASSVGWDYATGIGTINATNLVNGWPE